MVPVGHASRGRGTLSSRVAFARGTLRPMAASPDLSVQIFGTERDQATRAAVRFFKERRITIHQVDLTRKPIARGELRRFVDRLGARALLDDTSRAYRDGGLGYLRMDDAEIVERLLATPALLRLPLVRFRNDVTAGRDEPTWTRWVRSAAT
jgi:arsenate reductase